MINKFISEEKNSKITVVKEKVKNMKRPGVLIVLCLSVIGFCFGITATTITVSAIQNAKLKKSVGGFETPTMPEFNENLETLLDDVSTDAPVIADASTQENSENLITYETYRVKSGDMIGFIADEFGVTQDTIISVNNIKQSRLIQPGQYLKIPSMTGIIYTVRKNGETPESIAAFYEVDAQKFADVNSLALNASLSAGQSFFVPDAELDWITRQEINGDLFHQPLRARYWKSSPYGWRDSPFNTGKRTFHGGIDMACAQGTPVYAALDGKVSATGYNATYGNYVIITHHSGYKTLYGHLSAITCKKGNFVYTNTMIGRVGSTGMSTGPHLHFTVYKNGKTINPNTVLN